MSYIYRPKGKAREYSPFALNLYLNCNHRCRYCYAPRIRHQKEEQYHERVFPRKNLEEGLKKELKYEKPKEQVLLSFIGDPYGKAEDENQITRNVLEILLENKIPVAILTKAGERCLRDLEIFKKYEEHIQVGASLTFSKESDSQQWEENTASPEERLETLKILHEEGIKTFASFEPVIIPKQSLELMEKGIEFIDCYKIGKLNNFQGLDKKINWTDFLQKTTDLLRNFKKPFYIKCDLRKSAPTIKLFGNEVMPDEHNVS